MDRAIAAFLLASFAVTGSIRAADPGKPAPAAGLQEQVNVRLVQVDAVVVDKDGRTVPNLIQGDFKLQLGDKVHALDTFDAQCPIGAAEDPQNVNTPKQMPPPIGPGMKRKIIVALDYYFLSVTDRPQVLAAVEQMLKASKTPDEEVMLVALGYGVRVEQRFTSDTRQLVASLHRMGNDVTLWAREFSIGASGKEYLTDLATLMDVAGGHAGAKAVVFFSKLKYFDRPIENWFDDVALHAAAARAVIYPAYPVSMDSGWRSDALARIANQSGGRMPQQTVDITRPYRWAQRDLSCRYTLGVKLDDAESRKPQKVRVLLDEGKGKLRFPELVRFYTDEERRQASARAAYVDPGPYDNPLVRSFAFPLRPASGKAWDTLLAVSFPMPVGPAGGDFNLGAVITRDGVRVGKYDATLHVAPPAGAGPSRPVTVFGDTELQAGQHRLTVALSEPGGRQVVSAETGFQVPAMLDDLLILRGPAFARVVPGALTFHAADKGKAAKSKTKIEELLGADAGFEPLLVAEIDAKDALLSYWSACIHGKPQFGEGATVHRRVLDGSGKLVHEFPALPLKLESRGGGVLCQEMLDKHQPGKLPAGDYKYEVTVSSAKGEIITGGTAPLSVH